jgi:hypothetical protein
MVDLDIMGRVNLLKSAEDLYEQDDPSCGRIGICTNVNYAFLFGGKNIIKIVNKIMMGDLMTLDVSDTAMPEEQVKSAVLGALKNRIFEIDNNLDDLNQNLEYFQRKYNRDSEKFYQQFTSGSLGDKMDFLEWKASYEIYQELTMEKKALLEAVG